MQLTRIVKKKIDPDTNSTIPFSSPEDVILAKLEWYRLGNEISERQWLDVLGIMKVMVGDLDFEYLKSWAHQLNILDLLERAIEDAK